MKCPRCRNYYDGTESLPGQWNDPTDPLCPKCMNADYDSDMAIHRAKRINYYKELVVIGRAEFECTGYWLDGTLNDQEITINGTHVYGLLDTCVQDEIDTDKIRRIESEKIIKRIKAIEKALPDSDNPAGLRLVRSELDGQLEKLEVAR